jgi:4-hydroxy-2-oxoheptanedioate aldolase
MNSLTRGEIVSRARWVLCAVVLAWTVFPQGAQQTGAPQKRQRINTAIQRLEEGGVVDSTVKVNIEMEHQIYDLHELERQFAAYAAKRKPNGQLQQTPIVRLPTRGEQTTWMIEQVLDRGALGITFPLIENKAQALKAISTMRIAQKRGSKYPNPPGVRGAGMWTTDTFPDFPLWGGKIGPDEYMRLADVWPLNPEGELLAVIMVETAEGIKNINDILTVPGIGAIVVGSNDLQISLGIGRATRAGEDLAPETTELVLQVAKACTAKGVPWGVSVPGTEKKLQEFFKLGMRYRWSG